MRPARRPTVWFAIVLTLLAVAFAPFAGPAGAQATDDVTSTTLIPLDDQPTRSPSIIPTPNSSSQPTQYGVMLAVVAGLGVIGFLIYRESRRNPGRRTHTPEPISPAERKSNTP